METLFVKAKHFFQKKMLLFSCLYKHVNMAKIVNKLTQLDMPRHGFASNQVYTNRSANNGEFPNNSSARTRYLIEILSRARTVSTYAHVSNSHSKILVSFCPSCLFLWAHSLTSLSVSFVSDCLQLQLYFLCICLFVRPSVCSSVCPSTSL